MPVLILSDNKINMLTNTVQQPRTSQTPLPTNRHSLARGPHKEAMTFSTLRPGTSPLYNTLNVTGESQWVGLRSIDAVQDELEQTYRGEMCGYLRRKLRKLAGRHQEDIISDRYLPQEENPESSSYVSVGPLDQFYATFSHKSRVHAEKGVEGVYLNNAKEKIVRLIQRKREQQDDFGQVNNSIHVRREEKNHRRGRSLREQFVVPVVQNQQWDRSWRDSASKEKTRYRNRLLLKTNRELCTLAVVDFSK